MLGPTRASRHPLLGAQDDDVVAVIMKGADAVPFSKQEFGVQGSLWPPLLRIDTFLKDYPSNLGGTGDTQGDLSRVGYLKRYLHEDGYRLTSPASFAPLTAAVGLSLSSKVGALIIPFRTPHCRSDRRTVAMLFFEVTVLSLSKALNAESGLTEYGRASCDMWC